VIEQERLSDATAPVEQGKLWGSSCQQLPQVMLFLQAVNHFGGRRDDNTLSHYNTIMIALTGHSRSLRAIAILL
jgi:hypothetical protein